MCGIAGYIDLTCTTNEASLVSFGQKMAEVIAHRGPDAEGVWQDASQGIVLSHRRLAIIDVHAHAEQPMVSRCGRFVLVYNGEIYNFQSLREDLTAEGCAFETHSDTEVLLEGIACWGIHKTLERCNGMFAFAVWDRETRTLALARDRLGQKPLYYARQGNHFFFGSELKALRAHPCYEVKIDRDALALYLRYSYVPEPACIYEKTQKACPGELITISLQHSKEIQRERYWDLQKHAMKGMREPFGGSSQEAVQHLDALLTDSVSMRMISDVSLGGFLSGGIDSSLVVALMQKQSRRPVKTFTIGFNEKQFNEAEHAKAVAKHLGTDHTELYITPEQAKAVIPQLPYLYDEPFADMSQIPTFLVSELAKTQVTVALSGDGGDEFFAGYNRHFWVEQFWRRFGRLPSMVKQPVLGLLRLMPPQVWDLLLRNRKQAGDKVQKLAHMLAQPSQSAMYLDLLSQWKDPNQVILSAEEQGLEALEASLTIEFPSPIQKMMCLDMLRYLPGDILTKVDRASMGVSLEARAPLLDYRIAEFSWTLPIDFNVSNGQGKQLLREVLYRYVPKTLIERPKMGFGVPIGDWLRGDLRSWAEGLLNPVKLKQQGYFNPEPILKKWKQHQSGARNWQYPLWNILMFQSFLEAHHE